MSIFKNNPAFHDGMLTRAVLSRIIADQREALLRRPTGVEREALAKVEQYIDLPHVIVITGLRRCGKSTLMRQVIQKYYKDEDFYYINFEDERMLQFTVNDYELLYESQIELHGEKSTFFIDEIQVAPEFDRFLRRLYDSGIKFFVSGSRASLLREDIGSRLTGRHLDIVLKPFSFREFLLARGIVPPATAALPTTQRVEMKKWFDEYLATGGMPERVLFDNDEILGSIYDDIVIKDVVARHCITDVKSIRELYQVLFTNFCRKFSYNKLAKQVGIGSPNTVKNYIQHLEDTYLAVVLPRFEFSIAKQIMAEKKFYVVDNGFVGRVSPAVTIDKGWLLENHVVITLKDGENVSYYSKTGECDVVVRDRGEISFAVQVTLDLVPANRAREAGGLVEAMQGLRAKRGIIVTGDQEDEIQHDGVTIPVIPAWTWSLFHDP